MTRWCLVFCICCTVSTDTLAQADYKSEVQELRNQIQELRAEMAELRKLRLAPPGAPAVAEPVARVEPVTVPGSQSDNERQNSPPAAPASAGVNVYGFLALNAIHDFRATAPGDSFTNLPEQPLGPAAKGRTVITPQASRIGFDALTHTAGGAVHLKLETDFYGFCEHIPDQSCPRNRLRLRQAYGEYAGLLAGQTWSTFVDLDDWPDTLDFNGPNGLPVSRRPLIRYTMSDASAGYSAALAVESPVADGVSTNQGVHARTPNLVARFDQLLPRGAVNIRVLRHEKIDVASGMRKDGWGVGVGGRYKLGERDVLTGQVTRVDGDADMLAGSNGYVVTGDSILFDKNYGVLLGWQHVAGPFWQGYVVYGANWSDASDEFISAAGADLSNRRLDQIELGLIYSPVPKVEFGAEYVHGVRRTFGAQTGKMSRVELMAKYAF